MNTRTADRAAVRSTRVDQLSRLNSGYDVRVDGAIGYTVRLLPSGKRLDTYATCRAALERVLLEIEGRGRHERTLAVDTVFAGGETDLLAAGRSLRLGAEDAVGRPRPEPAPPLR